MRFALLFLLFLIILPFGSASIEILDGLEETYNLGEEIGFSVKVVPDDNINALIKLTLKCTEKEVPYYIAPLELEAGVEKTIEVPEIKAFSEGLCNIRVNVESLEGENLDGITSDEFTVSSLLDLSVVVDKTDVLPGDDIKSGEHTISVEVSDTYGNYGEEGVAINVGAVPTTFELYVNRKEFFPKESLEFMAYLLDQAGGPIDEEVNVKLFKKKTLLRDEIVVFDVLVKANLKYYFGFNYSTLPYDYILEGVFGDLEVEDEITILEYSQIDMRIEGDKVIVKNMGNVKYNNDTTIVLEKDGKKYILNKRIKLDVEEEMEIDLSKDVGSGSYTVTLPEETVVEEKIVEKVVTQVVEVPVEREAASNDRGIGKTVGLNANIVENVEIEDNRPAYKKGMSWITGGVIAGAGVLLNNPKSASFIMVIVILSLIGYFNREKIGKFIERMREKREKKF